MAILTNIKSRCGEGRCGSCINRKAVKLGTELLDIELWCLGRDIVSKYGNLLMEYGFNRERPQHDSQGSTRYRFELANGYTISVWGWGVLYFNSPVNGIFVKRYSFNPKVSSSNTELIQVWSPEYIPGLRKPQNKYECFVLNGLLADLIYQLKMYELWVQEEVGVNYRIECLKTRKKHSLIDGAQMPRHWETLGNYINKDVIIDNLEVAKKSNVI